MNSALLLPTKLSGIEGFAFSSWETTMTYWVQSESFEVIAKLISIPTLYLSVSDPEYIHETECYFLHNIEDSNNNADFSVTPQHREV